MKRTWTTLSLLLWACGGSQVPEAKTAENALEGNPQAQAAQEATAQNDATAPEGATTPKEAAATGPTATKTASLSAESQGCTPVPNAEPKVLTGEDQVFDSADRGHGIIFDVAGIAVEIPACTPDADMQIITVSWETQERPSATRIAPNFSRHAATLRVDRDLTALEGSPMLVRLQSKRELTKPGEKLVLAVEHSGECTPQNRSQKLESGGCSEWRLHDATYDSARNEMVARVPALGGYRLQFGWMPSKNNR